MWKQKQNWVYLVFVKEWSQKCTHSSADNFEKFLSISKGNWPGNNFLINLLSNFSSTNFCVVQTVKAGNGISAMDVVLSSKVTVTGCSFHWLRIFTTDTVQKITDTMTVITHQVLDIWKRAISRDIWTNYKKQRHISPFNPVAFWFDKIAKTMNCWSCTEFFDNFKGSLVKYFFLIKYFQSYWILQII